MKRNHSIFCALALAACCFLAGCANGETTTQTPPQEPTSTTDTQTTKVSYQLPTVHYLSESSIANTVLPLLKTMYGADIDGCSISTTLQQPELETENETFAFTMTDGTLYLADVDSENQIIAIETVAPKSDIPSDAAKQTDYIRLCQSICRGISPGCWASRSRLLSAGPADPRGSDDQQRLCCFPGDADLCGSLRRRGPRPGGLPPLRG